VASTTTTDSTTLLKRHLRRVSGNPCWGVAAEYGSWLSLQFGAPSLEIREAQPDAKSGYFSRRRVYLKGQHKLWIEMSDWEILEGKRRKFHSDQSRAQLRRAANLLHGQILVGFSLALRPLRSTFTFDGGSRLISTRYRKAKPDWELWHLYSPRSYIALCSDGNLKFSQLRAELQETKAAVTDFSI
jgi:hypothetical protein